MRLPRDIGYLSLDTAVDRFGPYPPLGFVPFPEHELGNGDCFGLYWPIGKEDSEPIVAEMEHDSWSICPAFSSVAVFLRVAASSDSEWFDAPSLENDPDSIFANYQQARLELKNRDFDSATSRLERVVSALPEFAQAQESYLGQLSRLRRTDQGFEVAINAAIGLPCLGGPSERALAWLRKQRSCPSEFESDPIWQNRDNIEFRFGGAKTNDTYRVLKAAIQAYLDQGESVRAATLIQTYGELMFTETVSFQERYDFQVDQFLEWQRDTCWGLGMSRDQIETPGEA